MLRFLDSIEEYLVAIMLGAMAVINFGNVLSRYVLNASWSFSAEIMLILFVWVVLLGSAVAYKRSEHLGMPALAERLPRRVGAALAIFSGLVSIALVGILIASGIVMLDAQLEFNQVTPVLELPQWIAGAAVPVGGIFIVVRMVQATVREFNSRLRNVKEAH